MEFEKGKVYNQVRIANATTGFNPYDFTTFRVISVNEGGYVMQTHDLFSESPSEFSKELVSESITNFSSIEYKCNNHKITEVTDPADYFVHSMAISPTEAIKNGLIEIIKIKSVFRDQSGEFIKRRPTKTHTSSKGLIGISLTLGVEKSAAEKYGNKYLQTVVFTWKTDKQMREEITSIFPNAWFL